MPGIGMIFEKIEEDPASRIFAALDRAEPRLQRAFVLAVTQIRNQTSLEIIAQLIEAGAFELALATAEAAWTGFADEVIRVYVTAAEDTGRAITRRLGVVVSFDQTNTRAVRSMQANRGRIISELTRGQREAVTEAITEGIRRGANPREQARNFRSAIGLTGRQEQSVNNFRTLLEENSAEALTRNLRDKRFDRTIRRALEEGEDLGVKTIDRMVTRYRERFVKFRSEVIARTEALRSVNEASDEMFQQAIDSGTIDPDSLIRVWNTSRDERVRGSHVAMHGQQQRVNEPFVSGNGNQLRFPGDPNAPASDTVQCRCVVAHRFAAVANANLGVAV